MMTATEQKRFERLATAIRRIASYQTVGQLQRSCEREYGLSYAETLEMAYDNIREEARAVVHLVKPRKQAGAKVSAAPMVGSQPEVRGVETIEGEGATADVPR
jgi:hypothetical protein